MTSNEISIHYQTTKLNTHHGWIIVLLAVSIEFPMPTIANSNVAVMSMMVIIIVTKICSRINTLTVVNSVPLLVRRLNLKSGYVMIIEILLVKCGKGER